MIAAAAMTPRSTPSASIDFGKPYGMNGVRLAESNAGSATTMNTASAISLNTTRIALSVALSRVPAMSMPATRKVMTIAGRLITPPACGPAMSAVGSMTFHPVCVCTHCRKPAK